MKKSLFLFFALFTALLPLRAGTELKKSVTWERIQANAAELPVCGRIKALPSELGRPSCWSVGCETLDRDYSDFESYREFVGLTGVGYGRLQSGWAKTETRKGRYDFSWLDRHVDGLLEQGVRPWICLCYGNPIYSDHGFDLNAKLFPDGKIMDAWLRYVEACVKRYKDKVCMYEIWNEPDNRRALDSYGLYANLFVRTAELIRRTDPDAVIAALGSCSPDRQYIRQFLDETAKLGGLGYVDYLSYHAYWEIPETLIPAIRELEADVAARSPRTRLLQGETGCPAQLEYGHALKNLEWDEYSQAKWDLRNMMVHFSMGIPYSVFTMVDLNYGWMMQSFGLIRMQLDAKPVYLRPKFYAVQHVTTVFGPGTAAVPEVSAQAEGRDDLYSFGLGRDGRKLGCVLWLGGSKPSSSLERTPCSVRITGMEFSDPVYLDLLTGLVHEIPGGSFCSLPLWDSPIVIVERSAACGLYTGSLP